MMWGKTVNEKKSKYPSWEFPKTCGKWKDSPLPTKKNYESISKVGKANNEEVRTYQNFEHEERISCYFKNLE